MAARAHGADGIAAALRAGVDSVEHGTYTNAETNALFKRSNAWLVPTMVAPHAALAQARAGTRSRATLAKAEEAVGVHNDDIRQGNPRQRAGGTAFGTDSGVSDHGKNAKEFALLNQGRHDAGRGHPRSDRRRGHLAAPDRSSQVGFIEPGKQADIIAVAYSPLDDVTVLEHRVMRDAPGRGPRARRRPTGGSAALSGPGNPRGDG